MKYTIVCTTIFVPKFLESYCKNIEKYGHKDNVKFYIIPDKKTPPEAAGEADIYRSRGFNINYVELSAQKKYLDRFPILKGKIPYNSDNRRNIGFLMAYEDGANVLISIDDDNYVLEDHDFILAHSVCGKEDSFDVIESSSGWFNTCELLEVNPSINIFPRGFPYRIRRGSPGPEISSKKENAKIGINLGLWTKDPDIDAISRNFMDFQISAWKNKSLVFGKNTWIAVNTQNTSLVRELIPAFYYVRMGFDIGGTKIDRFGDIMAGYFCQKIAKSLGYSIRVGSPICEHKRTPHNLFDDLYHEWAGIVLLEDVTLWLEQIELEGETVKDIYRSLAQKLNEQADRFDGYLWNDQSRDFIREISSCMITWIEAIDIIDSGTDRQNG
ncbi:MAG: hypothetical protein U9R44_01610 [Candidatus Omnitrophota bacterium]|nr:hypothetical protein [Candidatus Omnitrophota bacterium]